jgi:GT2 family glycosyltransferase
MHKGAGLSSVGPMDTLETPDSRPRSTRAGVLDPGQLTTDGGEPELGQVAPPVVAIIVTHDAGPWLEETVHSFALQDYPSLSVLVLDNGSADDPTALVAAAMPNAFVRRLTADQGFATAANEALRTIEGAPFLLFCHDDVVLDADAVRVMVEEAYRSNAGIVGPKIVDHDHPEILLEVGMAVDHYGVPFSGIEPDEIDQEQHDAVRDVFFVSHATMLVRADLFHELSGFDPATAPGSDDVDLCWRARLAGARVIVAPDARVRHRRATVTETRRSRAQARHSIDVRAETEARLRLLYKSYSGLGLVWVLPVAFALGVVEAVALTFTGRARRARSLLAGWFAGLRHLRGMRAARAETQKLRRVDDHDVRELMIRGSARVRSYTVRHLHAGDRLADLSNRTRVRMSESRAQLGTAPAILAVVLAVVVLFGSRSLLLGRVPEIGSFRAWPGVGALWSTFTSPWRYTMMGAPVAATPAFGLMALLSTVLLGHEGLARSLIIGGGFPLGVWGTYRLVRPLAAPVLPAVVAAVAYAANPIARNAISRGELGPLVTYALAPFMLHALVIVAGSDTTRSRRRHAAVTVALLTAVAASVWPPALLLAAVLVAAVALAVPFVGGVAEAGRVALVGLAGLVVGALLLVPWLASLFGADAATLGFLPRPPLSLGDALHFQTGPAATGFVAWGLVAAAAVPLAIATGPRLAWAARAWMLAAISFTLAWLPSRLSASAPVPAPEGVLVGAALGLALAAGLGVAAYMEDLRRFHFGWRQFVGIVVAVGLALPFFGLAVDAFSGRWGTHSDDWPASFSWMNDDHPKGGFRVMWLGDPTVLPVGPKVTSDGVGYALTRDGTGDARALSPAPESSADRAVADAITLARAGRTARLGHLLAPTGVRYIAFIERATPTHGAMGQPDPALADALRRQLDLSLTHTDEAGTVYQNEAWMPRAAVVPRGNSNVKVDGKAPLAAALQSDPTGARAVGVSGAHLQPAGPGTLLWSEASNDNWRAATARGTRPRHDAFGWTNAFTLPRHEASTMHYDGDMLRSLLLFLELGAWIVLAAAWVIGHRRATKSIELQL